MNELEANAIITDEATGGKYDRGERLAIIFNPLNPPVLGDFWVWGCPPNPWHPPEADPLHSPVVKQPHRGLKPLTLLQYMLQYVVTGGLSYG
jgi:hypothetical protein